MATTTSPQCDYIPLDKSSSIFAEQFTDLPHVNEQILHLDDHFRQLYKLRCALLHRSNQFRPPSYTLPFEVLSRIFQETVPSVNRPYGYYYECRAILRQSFILSSVSKHFRQVALGALELWERIGFSFTEALAHKFTPFFKHCTTYARPRVLSSRFDLLYVPSDGDIRTITDTLFSPDLMRNVHTLDLGRLPRGLSMPPISSTFPVLNVLIMDFYASKIRHLDLSALPLSRVTLVGITRALITLPPVVRYLNVINMQSPPPFHFLHQCTNLVECFIDARLLLDNFNENLPALTLCHINRLTCKITSFNIPRNDILRVRDLRMPTLEYLEIQITPGNLGYPRHFHEHVSDFVLQLGRQVPSLKSLFLSLDGIPSNAQHTLPLRVLFRSHWVNLQKLTISNDPGDLAGAVRALTPQDEDYSEQESKYLPNLQVLDLGRSHGTKDLNSVILDMLKKTEFGLTGKFMLALPSYPEGREADDTPPEWKKEFTSIVNSRHIQVLRRHRVLRMQGGA